MKEYTPDLAGSGQFARCAHCKLDATKDGHDGCLGELSTEVVMNACCGHGDVDIAYVQYWDGSCIRGEAAIKEQAKLKEQQNEEQKG